MSIVGKSEVRVDAFDKATGRTKYYEDRMPAGALYARIKHSEIAHGYVKSIDVSAAEAIEGVVKVLTCFDVPDIAFPTAGHPWSMDPGHQDVADRHLLNRHVRYYGDEVAVVIAENEVAAMQGVRALKVEYDVLPFVLDVQKAMEPDAPQIHEECPGNVFPISRLMASAVTALSPVSIVTSIFIDSNFLTASLLVGFGSSLSAAAPRSLPPRSGIILSVDIPFPPSYFPISAK